MAYSTLVSTADLARHLNDPLWVLVDCRFDLFNPDWGEQAHLPGAVYAHLDRDLAGRKTGRNGRHPLPDLDAFRATLGGWGIGPGTQVVAYDQADGMCASRLWWMLQYLGHEAVAVLDGGWARWFAEARPTRNGVETRPPAAFHGEPRPHMLATLDEVERRRSDPGWCLIDSRSPERYRGEVEPLDPVAGRIPGALNLFNLAHVDADGRLLDPAALRAKFLALLGGRPPSQVITYCGSGVAAAHNVLAMQAAGLPDARVYVGSWSEWCADPQRPVETGE